MTNKMLWSAAAIIWFIMALITFAHAGTPSPAQMGLDKSATTGNLSVRDVSGAWVEVGSVNGSSHTFQIPSSSLSSPSVTVGGVICTLGSTCAPSATVGGTVCTLGSTCAPSTTINGIVCTLGSSCSSSQSITVGGVTCTLGSACSPATTVGGAVCTLGSTCAPTTTVNGVTCTLGSSCSLGTSVIVVGATATSGGAAGQLMFDTGSVLTESAALVFTNPALKIVSNTASLNMGASGDTILLRDGAGQLGQRNATNPQIFAVYDSFSSSTSYERAVFDWQTTSNVLLIGTEQGSGGGPTLGQFEFVANGANEADFGVTTPGFWTFVSPMNVQALSAVGTVAGSALASTSGSISAATISLAGSEFFGPFLEATGAAPTVASGHIAYGATTTANTSCGTLSGSAGCIVINVAGTTRHVPYY